MVHCVLTLEKRDRVYHDGEMVKGVIELHVDKPKKFRGLYVHFHGVESFSWTKIGYQNTNYIGRNFVLEKKGYLFGYKGADAVKKMAGVYRYDFEVQLPAQLPASVKGSYGTIQYHVEAVLDVPWGSNKTSSLEFSVVDHDDLNLNPNLLIPIDIEKIRFYNSCFHSNPLKMTVIIPCSGFVPGQSIWITVSYINKSVITVNETRIKLCKITRYIHNTKSKNHIEEVAKVCCGGVGKRQQGIITKSLEIPLNASMINMSIDSIIRTRYELHVEAVRSLFFNNVKLIIPIGIGSIPLTFCEPEAGHIFYMS